MEKNYTFDKVDYVKINENDPKYLPIKKIIEKKVNKWDEYTYYNKEDLQKPWKRYIWQKYPWQIYPGQKSPSDKNPNNIFNTNNI